MKTLALIFALTLTMGAFASEDLGLSDCSKGADIGRGNVKSSTGSGDVNINSSETSQG